MSEEPSNPDNHISRFVDIRAGDIDGNGLTENDKPATVDTSLRWRRIARMNGKPYEALLVDSLASDPFIPTPVTQHPEAQGMIDPVFIKPPTDTI